MSVTSSKGTEPTDPLKELSSSLSDLMVKPKVYSQHQWLTWLGFVAIVALLPLVISGGYDFNIAQNSALMAILALGFYWQFALGGQFSFATPAYYATGAYVSAWAVGHGGFIVAFIAAVVITGAVGAATKVLLFRSPLIHFAIATLAVGELALIVYQNWTSFTGGGAGKYGIPLPSIGGYQFDTPTRQFYLEGGVLLIGLALTLFFERSPAQRDLTFTRDMDVVAKTSGLRTSRAQIVSFAIGAGFMGAAGSLLAHTSGFIGIDSFDISIALSILLMVLLGGIGFAWGPIIGAVVLTVLPQVLNRWLNYEDLVYALAILAVVLFLPGGLTSLPAEVRMRWGRRRLKANVR